MTRVLVAEDETLIRLDLKGLLESAGFEVCAEARDGEEAVELARTTEPDVALLDVKMPRLDGIEAARRILDERPIPIVMVTAYGERELVARAVEAGVFGYLVKPFRETDLLPAIATATARHDELRALREEADSLAEALAARKAIERAKGILMQREGLSEERGLREAPEGEPDLGAAAQGRRRGADRDARRNREPLGREQPLLLVPPVEAAAEPHGDADERERGEHDEHAERDHALPRENVQRLVDRAVDTGVGHDRAGGFRGHDRELDRGHARLRVRPGDLRTDDAELVAEDTPSGLEGRRRLGVELLRLEPRRDPRDLLDE